MSDLRKRASFSKDQKRTLRLSFHCHWHKKKKTLRARLQATVVRNKVSINSKLQHPSPRATPGHLLLVKFPNPGTRLLAGHVERLVFKCPCPQGAPGQEKNEFVLIFLF